MTCLAVAAVVVMAPVQVAWARPGAQPIGAVPAVGPANFDALGTAIAVSGQVAVVGADGVNDGAGAAYVFVRSGSAWRLKAALTDPRGNPDDAFGVAVAVSGGTAVIGAAEGTFVYARSGSNWRLQATLPTANSAGDPSITDMAISGSTIALQIFGGVGIYVRTKERWRLATTLRDPDGHPGRDEFGYAMALAGTEIVVGAPYAAKSAGMAYVYSGSGAHWELKAALSNPDAKSGDNYGVGVAISGGIALVGSVNETNYSNGIAYVYVRSGSRWQRQATLTAPPGDRYLYGQYLALDGATAVVTTLGSSSGGLVFVYGRSGAQWRRIARFADPGAYEYDYFGSAVSLSGPVLVVGASGAIDGNGQGAFYIYARTGSRWRRQAAITDPRGSNGSFAGSAVAIAGSVAIVAADGAGSADIYVRSRSRWRSQAVLYDPDGASYFNDYGVSAAISSTTAMVGADYWDSDAGRVYVYTRRGARWIKQAALTDKKKVAAGGFGTSVTIYGNTALIGAPGIFVSGAEESTGIVYVYQRVGTAWRLRSTLTDPYTGFGGNFGSAVALSGTTALIGADSVQAGRGEAFVYTRSGTRWRLAARLADPDGKYYDDFGSTVAVSGRTVVVGANGVGKFHGAAYIYGQSGARWRRQAVLTDPHGVPDANFGWAVAASGSGASTRVLVTVLYLSGLATGPRQCGSAFEYTRKASGWREFARIADPGCRSYDDFGYSIAVSGKTAIIGAPGHDSNSGAGYVLNLPATGG
jgi:hypothetical protein